MSMRPAPESTCCVKVGVTLPWRMNVPSDTLRTRSSAGLNVMEMVTADRRDAPVIDTGTV
jgi:hypothetical protein